MLAASQQIGEQLCSATALWFPSNCPSPASPVDPRKDCSKVLSLNFAFVLDVCREKEGQWDLIFLSVRKLELGFLGSFTKGWDEQNRNPVLN